MFILYWSLSAAVLIVLAYGAGMAGGQGAFGILVDARGRYSLNRLQLVCWTIVILSSFLGVFWAQLGAGRADVPEISPTLLGLLGISVGSAVLSGAVKASKDAARAAIPHSVSPAQARLAGGGHVRRFWQIFLEEEGTNADQIVSVSKFQNFLFTAALLILYVVMTASTGHDAQPSLPTFDSEHILWLIGISHAGYIAGKMPNRT